MKRLVGKVAVVTGATGGIGAAIARRLAEEGGSLVLAGRRPPSSDAPSDSVYVAGDVVDEAYVSRLMEVANERFGGLDILVNAHGLDLHSSLGETPLAAARELFDVNILGVFLTIKHAIPALAARGGAIVNLSSRLGQVAIPGQALYGATKSAVDQLTRGAAIDLAPLGVRVNSVAPGITETEMIDAWVRSQDEPAKFKQQLIADVPLRRMAKPEEIAASVAFLASSDAAYITGVTLTVDGGYTAR